jgi:tetratricopeptide (TPR) repeat protein
MRCAGMEIRKVTSADLVRRLAAIARQDQHNPRALFTILTGAGVSLGAGMPSTATLVAAMSARKAALAVGGSGMLSWPELLTNAEQQPERDAAAGTTAEYQAHFNDDAIFPSPLHRQRFISEAIVWASGRQAPLSPESLRIASILLAGVGRRAEATATAQKGTPLGRWLAHTLYTTNFDEVIPQTLRYCGEPVIIVDHPGAHGRLQGEANYPRICYLHGCHLHYALRNTATELGRADADRTGGVDITGLFLRFRDVLRSTGLIVLGYSGWNDRAVRAIRDALADEESLPYGVYWGARFGEKSLSDTALQLLRQHPDRAFMLDEGKDASTTLESLCVGLEIPFSLDMDRWRSRLTGVQTHFDLLAGKLGPSAPIFTSAPASAPTVSKQAAGLQRDLDQSQLVKDGGALMITLDLDKVRDWLARVDAFVAREGLARTALLPDLLAIAGFFRRLNLDFDGALEDLRAAYERLEVEGAEQRAAEVLLDIGRTLEASGRLAEAETTAVDVATRFRKLGDTDSYVAAMASAIRAARLRGRFGPALRWIEETRAEVERADPEVRGDFYDELARTLGRMGKTAEAEEAGLLALKFAHHPMARANAHMVLGGLAVDGRRLQDGKKYYSEVLALSEGMKEPLNQICAEIGLAEAALDARETKEALAHLQRAKKLARGDNLPWGLQHSLNVLLAETSQKLALPGDHEGAVAATIEQLEKGDRRDHVLQARMTLARIKAHAGDIDGARNIATAVRSEAAALGEGRLMQKADGLLAELEAPASQRAAR